MLRLTVTNEFIELIKNGELKQAAVMATQTI